MKKILLTFSFIAILYAGCNRKTEKVTYSSPSPSGRYALKIIEPVHALDRNFRVYLEDSKLPNQLQLIFVSPDESRPASERALWSSDEKCVLLVSDSVLVSPEIKLRTGEKLNLLYSLEDRKLWCNSSQLRMESFDLNRITNCEIHL